MSNTEPTPNTHRPPCTGLNTEGEALNATPVSIVPVAWIALGAALVLAVAAGVWWTRIAEEAERVQEVVTAARVLYGATLTDVPAAESAGGPIVLLITAGVVAVAAGLFLIMRAARPPSH